MNNIYYLNISEVKKVSKNNLPSLVQTYFSSPKQPEMGCHEYFKEE